MDMVRKTSLQKLGGHASRRVSSVRKKFGPGKPPLPGPISGNRSKTQNWKTIGVRFFQLFTQGDQRRLQNACLKTWLCQSQPIIKSSLTVTTIAHPYPLGCIDKYFSSISIPDTLFPLYFLILRQVCFLAFFDLRTPSFANLPIYIY